ncbi:MAG: hypothetical protein M4D80_22425 [Myxococcota bacterium]|nr:hypothetical protein [Myxococcota bacterium]
MHEVITIRGAFRFATRGALEDALWSVRVLLDDKPPPLRFRCWVTARNTLSVDLSVPMFVEHDVGPVVCETLAKTAIVARCVVRAKPRFAEGTGARRRTASGPTWLDLHGAPELDRVLDELISSSS